MNTDDHIDNVARRVGRAVVALGVAAVVFLLFGFGIVALKRYYGILVPSVIINGVQYGLTIWAVMFAFRKPLPSKSETGEG